MYPEYTKFSCFNLFSSFECTAHLQASNKIRRGSCTNRQYGLLADGTFRAFCTRIASVFLG